MAPTRRIGLGSNPFNLSPYTPGPLGVNDSGTPDLLGILHGDTPSPVGCNDLGAPDLEPSLLGIPRLQHTICWDEDLGSWEIDPDALLEDEHLNPDFVAAARRALMAAVSRGLRPRVHEAYRSPEESDRKHAKWKKKQGGKANPAWQSCHNYGIAMDVYLFDRKGKYIDNKVKGWYKLYKILAEEAKREGFVWGENFGKGDADHFEYHPTWPRGANGKFLMKMKVWSEQTAAALPGASGLAPGAYGPPREPSPDDWMPFFWWAAGVEGTEPPQAAPAPPTP
jgi:D-alanyl-D-alanine carboxypeptidase-like protein